MGCILHVKSSTSANQCLSTKHRRRKPRVLRSVSSGHGPPVRCNSLIPDVVMETDLCKDVAITVSDFQQALGANATETQCYRYTCFKNTLEKPVFEKTAWYVHTAINAEKLNFFQLLKTCQDTWHASQERYASQGHQNNVFLATSEASQCVRPLSPTTSIPFATWH